MTGKGAIRPLFCCFRTGRALWSSVSEGRVWTGCHRAACEKLCPKICVMGLASAYAPPNRHSNRSAKEHKLRCVQDKDPPAIAGQDPVHRSHEISAANLRMKVGILRDPIPIVAADSDAQGSDQRGDRCAPQPSRKPRNGAFHQLPQNGCSDDPTRAIGDGQAKDGQPRQYKWVLQKQRQAKGAPPKAGSGVYSASQVTVLVWGRLQSLNSRRCRWRELLNGKDVIASEGGRSVAKIFRTCAPFSTAGGVRVYRVCAFAGDGLRVQSC